MSAAFMVSAILLVAVLVLFIDERKTSCGLRDDIKQQRETIDKSYTIDPSSYDMPLLREAGREVTDTIFIGKILFSTDNTSLYFQDDAYEPAYKHFRDSLECYINIIHNMQDRPHEVYEKKQKQKEEQKQLDAFGFRKDESAPNHKILS